MSDYRERYGVTLPSDGHARARELARLRQLDDDKPNKSLQRRLRTLERIDKLAKRHHSLNRRREGRVSHRHAELDAIDSELRQLTKDIGPTPAERALAERDGGVERLGVRAMQRQRLRIEIADEHAGERYTATRPTRPARSSRTSPR